MIPILALCMVALFVTPATAESWLAGGEATADTGTFRQADDDDDEEYLGELNSWEDSRAWWVRAGISRWTAICSILPVGSGRRGSAG
jgi:hypothetical protein